MKHAGPPSSKWTSGGYIGTHSDQPVLEDLPGEKLHTDLVSQFTPATQPDQSLDHTWVLPAVEEIEYPERSRPRWLPVAILTLCALAVGLSVALKQMDSSAPDRPAVYQSETVAPVTPQTVPTKTIMVPGPTHVVRVPAPAPAASAAPTVTVTVTAPAPKPTPAPTVTKTQKVPGPTVTVEVPVPGPTVTICLDVDSAPTECPTE
jgi:hypothetical protein